MKTLYGDLAIPPRCSATWHAQISISQPLWKSRMFFLSQNKSPLVNFIFTRLQYRCHYCSSLLPSMPPFISALLKINFPFRPSLYHLDTLGLPPAPPSELTHRQWLWWAVVLFQAPQAGKLCQSESLCFLITAVRCKPKLAIRKVTFILFPTLFLCPWLPELRFFFSSASSAWIQKQAEWSSYLSFKLTWKLPEFRLVLRIFTICTVIYILNLLDSSAWHEQSSSALWVIPRSDEKLVMKSGVSVVPSCLFIIKAWFSISIG